MRERKKQAWSLYRYSGGVIFFLALLFSLGCLLMPVSAAADGIRGLLEFNYSATSTKTEDSGGESSNIKSNSFNQLYNLSYRRAIYPNLILDTGGMFERNIISSIIDDEKMSSSITNVRPFVDLTLRSQVFTLGGKYNIREERTTGFDTDPVIDINETYNVIFGWKPEGLPSLDMRLERSNTFDKERISQDTVIDTVSMALRYEPEYGHFKGLELRYQPSYRRVENNLDEVINIDTSHNGRASYSDQFFDRRVTLFTSYNIAYNESEAITSSKTGEISSQLFPFSGLSAISDTPAKVVLDLNSALIDGILTSGAGIDIGLPSTGGDNRPRNIGIDFVTVTEVNSISVWVDKELPVQISGSFKWDVYTSRNNQDWSLAATVNPAPFGPFENRFEIDFASVSARYIKVVTSPLKVSDTIGVRGDFSNIFVTEIQAFIKKPAGNADSIVRDTRTNQIYNLDVRTRLLNAPALFYEFSYFLTKAASSFTNTTISNGFSVSHSFNTEVSAQARVAREDAVQLDEKEINYLYNASITARPLKTLSHTFNYSGQTHTREGERDNTNSVFIKNSAELYRGININIDGGTSLHKKDTGETTTNTMYSFGSGIVPHRRVTIDLYYTSTNTKESGGDEGDSSDFTRRGTLGVSYKPFDTVYLFASLEEIKTKDKKRDLQNYGANWSPFPDGSLQFSFAYNESLTSDEGTVRQISPNIRWSINSRTFMDLSSQFIKSESETQKADSVSSSATLRMVF